MLFFWLHAFVVERRRSIERFPAVTLPSLAVTVILGTAAAFTIWLSMCFQEGVCRDRKSVV